MTIEIAYRKKYLDTNTLHTRVNSKRVVQQYENLHNCKYFQIRTLMSFIKDERNLN